jgi:hypothetical protein
VTLFAVMRRPPKMQLFLRRPRAREVLSFCIANRTIFQAVVSGLLVEMKVS